MPNARVLAAAGGLPSRRAALATLAGAGAALALPKAAKAASITTSPDAALIAQAALVERLARLAEWAWGQHADADSAHIDAKPERPTIPAHQFAGGLRELEADVLRQHIADHVPDATHHSAEWLADRQQRLARMEAYDAECARLKRRFRVDAVTRMARRADDRLEDAAAVLADMRPVTMAGLIAKARAAGKASCDDYLADPWIISLSASVLRDVRAIGGAA